MKGMRGDTPVVAWSALVGVSPTDKCAARGVERVELPAVLGELLSCSCSCACRGECVCDRYADEEMNPQQLLSGSAPPSDKDSDEDDSASDCDNEHDAEEEDNRLCGVGARERDADAEAVAEADEADDALADEEAVALDAAAGGAAALLAAGASAKLLNSAAE